MLDEHFLKCGTKFESHHQIRKKSRRRSKPKGRDKRDLKVSWIFSKIETKGIKEGRNVFSGLLKWEFDLIITKFKNSGNNNSIKTNN